MKKSTISVIFPSELLKKVDENAFRKITSRSDFVLFAINDFFVREEKAREEKEHHENQKER